MIFIANIVLDFKVTHIILTW